MQASPRLKTLRLLFLLRYLHLNCACKAQIDHLELDFYEGMVTLKLFDITGNFKPLPEEKVHALVLLTQAFFRCQDSLRPEGFQFFLVDLRSPLA